MNYYFMALLVFGVSTSIMQVKESKRKKQFISFYIALLIIVFVYMAGEAFGKMLYYVQPF